MRLKRSLVIAAAALFATVVLVICLAPLLVAGGLRFWAQRAARREGLQLEFGRIEAPLLRPVIVHDFRFRSDTNAPFQIDGTAPRLEVALNLAAIFTHSRRPVRSLVVDGLTLDIRQNHAVPPSARPAAWSLVENLLADNFKFSGVRLHVENGPTTIDLRDGALSGSEMEAGVFSAREITIASPWFKKTLTQLRGATSWQESRLALGAVSLMPGLDVDTITIDLAQIGDSRVGMEMNLDAFGGKIRARVSSDDRGGKRTWDMAGNATGVSLARMSDALEWNNRASGSLHASKFTFRGELNDLRNATAAVWAEISGLTWRDRTADTVMIGASLYNREIQIEQLYIKQRDNQLTLSGEFAWPENFSGFITPAFRGDLSATINNLGEFARLFGWSPTDFSGTLAANGSVNAREGKFGGELSVSGNSLVLFRSPIESLDIKLGLRESRLEIAQFELHQQNDFLRAEGGFNLSADHAYNATMQCSVGEIGNYRGFIPPGVLPFALTGSGSAEWKGRGANGSDSGTIHARGRGLRDTSGVFAPFEAEVEADYSPDNVFFRQIHFWNQRADLSAFVTAAKDYFQVQELRLSLNNRARLEGNIYVPVSAAKLRRSSPFLAALSSDPFFDIDLALDNLDLAELAAAIKSKSDMTGNATGRIQLSGTPASLQGKTEFHLRDFVLDASPALSADIETQLALGVANFKASVVTRGSDPVRAEGAVPFRFQKRETDYTFASDGPLSVSLNFPAIFLGNLPHYLARGIFTRGILTGNMTIADSLRQPLVTGSVNLIDAQFLRGPAVSAGLTFKGRSAALDFVHLKSTPSIASAPIPSLDAAARGEIDFADLDAINLKIFPAAPILASSHGLAAGDCVSSVEFYPTRIPSTLPAQPIQEIGLSGSLFGGLSAISFPSPNGVDPAEVFPFCRDSSSRGKTLLLVVPSLSP
jgi:hypothetical protein